MNVVFNSPDDPEKGQSLQDILKSIANIPILGLVIKTEKTGLEERIVNWQFMNAETVKAFALVHGRPPRSESSDEDGGDEGICP
jgi:hypothetical protein